jgi:hypothetical protein
MRWRGTPRCLISFCPMESAFSIFRVPKLGFFVKRLPKREIES